MRRGIAFLALTGLLVLSSCAKKEGAESATPSAEAPAAAQPPIGPHALVHLKDGSRVPGTVVASSQTDMVVAGDDGIERKIPMAQIKSVEYTEAPTAQSAPPSAPAAPSQPPPPPPPEVNTRTYELPAGSELSIRMNEGIDSGTATEGQRFDAQLTRDARDANGNVVIPRGSRASVVIKSASRGGRFRGASDLVLDLQTVTINQKQYRIDAADISQKGKSGVGANKRTATYGGGGAALGAIIGAIAGGGKGAAIGAGAGAGAGVLTQVLTKGGSIKVPAESVLTFSLDKSLWVTEAD
jgi:hypothetical protein